MQKEFNKVKPYVYWIKNNNTGIKYFGVRWGNINKNRTPVQDLGKTYFSSGVLAKDFKKNPDNFRIKLISTFDTKEEARDYEHRQNKKNILIYLIGEPHYSRPEQIHCHYFQASHSRRKLQHQIFSEF